MIYEIRMTPEAKSDLRGIYEYIAFDLQSIQNASGQFERLEKSIASLIDI
jgi:plasmid stabilization system protein ParE